MAICFFLAAYGQSMVVAADKPANARAALQKRSYPWYDAKSDAFRPVSPEKEPERWNLDFNLPFAQIILWVLLGIVVALLLMALFQWARTVVFPVERDDGSVVETQVSLERLEALPEMARGVRDLMGEAMRLASVGDYAQAMVFYFSWQLVELDKQQALELQKGKTNRRYLSEVAQSRPDVAELFRLSIRLFEDAFFGSLSVSRENFDRVWNQRSSFDAKSGRPGT
jgi:hypothetical protein